jgi:hypothetical protein
MHLIFAAVVTIFSLVKGDWRNWEEYYPTMLYISLSTFLYEFISHSHFHLWELQENSLLNLMNVHFVHSLIINPLIAFIYLSKYPQKPQKQITYSLIWILAILLLEWAGEHFGLLSYHNGWHFGWSTFFVIIMFPMVRLHHIHKLWALISSVIFVVFYLIIFDYL